MKQQVARILLGTIIGSGGTAAATLLSVRWLGATDFGVAAVGIAILTVCQRLTTFDTWQAGLRFIPLAESRSMAWGPRSLMRSLFYLDMAGATGSAVLSATIGALVFSSVTGIKDSDAFFIAAILQLGIVSSAAIAVLRLHGRTLAVSLGAAAGGLGKLTCIVFFGRDKLTPDVVIVVFSAVDMVVAMLILLSGFFVARSHYQSSSHSSPTLEEKREFFSFVKTVYLHGTLKTTVKELDVLIVGAIGTVAAAGLYKIARQFSGIIMKLAEPVSQVIFPVMSRWEAGGQRQRMARLIKTYAMSSAFLTALVIGLYGITGRTILSLTLGMDIDFITTLSFGLVLTGVLLAFASLPLQGYFIARGLPQINLRAVALATLVQFSVLVPLCFLHPMFAGSLAFFVFYAVWSSHAWRSYCHDLSRTK